MRGAGTSPSGDGDFAPIKNEVYSFEFTNRLFMNPDPRRHHTRVDDVRRDRLAFFSAPACTSPLVLFSRDDEHHSRSRARSGWGRDARGRPPLPPPPPQARRRRRMTPGRWGYSTRRRRAPPKRLRMRRRETHHRPRRRRASSPREAERARPTRRTTRTTARTTRYVVCCGTRGTSTTTSSSRRCGASGAAAAGTGRRSAPARPRHVRAICAATPITSRATAPAGCASTASDPGTGAATATRSVVSVRRINRIDVCGAAIKATPCSRASAISPQKI